jgi:hypothetical protein
MKSQHYLSKDSEVSAAVAAVDLTPLVIEDIMDSK